MFCAKCGGKVHLFFAKNDEITNLIANYIQNNFYIKEGIDLNKDPQSLKRILEAAEEAKVELLYKMDNRENINISIPFITATPDGPKHLDDNLTKSKLNELISPRSYKFCTNCNQNLNKPRTSSENKLECIKCHKELKKGSKFCPYCGTKQDQKLINKVNINPIKDSGTIDKEEVEKMKNYEGSESYKKMMSKYKGSTDRKELNKERLAYKKAAVDLAKSNRGYGWLVLILLCVIIPPLWPLVIIWFVIKIIGIFIEGFNEK